MMLVMIHRGGAEERMGAVQNRTLYINTLQVSVRPLSRSLLRFAVEGAWMMLVMISGRVVQKKAGQVHAGRCIHHASGVLSDLSPGSPLRFAVEG
jgi:hypothetical protein